MTNLFKRFFTHKSKFLLIIISLLGLAFSYSCSCRDNPVAPPPETPEGENTEPKILTPSATLSRNVMIVNADGNDTPYPITITVTDADISSYTVSGLDGLELQKNGDVFSVKNGFDKIGNAETDITLNVNYQKKSTAGANDTIAEGKDTGEIKFKVLKAEKYDNSKVENQLKLLGTAMLGDGTIKFYNAKLSGVELVLSEGNKITQEINTSSFISSLKSQIIESKKTEADLKLQSISETKEPVVSSDGKTATFYLELDFGERIETEKFNKDLPLEIKISLKLDDDPNTKAKWNKQ